MRTRGALMTISRAGWTALASLALLLRLIVPGGMMVRADTLSFDVVLCVGMAGETTKVRIDIPVERDSDDRAAAPCPFTALTTPPLPPEPSKLAERWPAAEPTGVAAATVGASPTQAGGPPPARGPPPFVGA